MTLKIYKYHHRQGQQQKLSVAVNYFIKRITASCPQPNESSKKSPIVFVTF
jgi:hypothetical protein